MYNDESFDALFNKANDDIQNQSFGYNDGPLQIELFHLHGLKNQLNDAKVLGIGRRWRCGRKCDILNE
jgi:hypothetical protein